MIEGFGPGSNGPMLIAVSLSKPAHNDQADLDKLRNQQQKAMQQEISKQQAKSEKKIQQQAQQAQEQAEQKIQEQADQAKQQAGPREQEAIDQLAQQEIDKQNQAIEQQAKQEIDKQNQAIEQQAQEEAAKKEKSSGQEDKEKFLESKSSDPRLTALRTDLQKTKGVDKVTLPLVNKNGDAAVYTVTATTAPSSRPTEDLVTTLATTPFPRRPRASI